MADQALLAGGESIEEGMRGSIHEYIRCKKEGSMEGARYGGDEEVAVTMYEEENGKGR